MTNPSGMRRSPASTAPRLATSRAVHPACPPLQSNVPTTIPYGQSTIDELPAAARRPVRPRLATQPTVAPAGSRGARTIPAQYGPLGGISRRVVAAQSASVSPPVMRPPSVLRAASADPVPVRSFSVALVGCRSRLASVAGGAVLLRDRVLRLLGRRSGTEGSQLVRGPDRSGRAASGRWGGRDEGSATVELAASLPALVLLLFAALAAVTAVRTQVQCVDAAREAARAAARGESGVAAGARVAPAGSSVEVSAGSDTVRATVSVWFSPLGGDLPGLGISATSVAAIEPGGGDE